MPPSSRMSSLGGENNTVMLVFVIGCPEQEPFYLAVLVGQLDLQRTQCLVPRLPGAAGNKSTE